MDGRFCTERLRFTDYGLRIRNGTGLMEMANDVMISFTWIMTLRIAAVGLITMPFALGDGQHLLSKVASVV
jgi:hypothetical protein